MLTTYTLKNCDTCKKALKWLEAKGIEFENIDVRADGLSKETISKIVETLGWETALNRRSTTWRGLDDADKSEVDKTKAVELIEENPTLMKRPIFESQPRMIAGFDAKAQAALQELFS